ncbi:MAG TPA: efflux RND transporter periplasmic adaptor subunit [Patescibacteria group bacterium]|nr:efflux RND transporter periplasmic adaptor subunit [Patescibacteria group bacterium]
MATKKRSTKKTALIVTAVLIILGGTLIGLIASKSDKGIEVTTEKVSRRTITQTVSAIGKIQPETEVKISSEASGEIMFLQKREGDRVEKGELIFRIKPDLVQTQLEQFKAGVDAAQTRIAVAKSDLERTQRELKRVAGLFEKEFASRNEFEQAQTAFEQAQSRYEAAIADRQQAEAAYRQTAVSASRTTIYAPMSGTVTSLSVEQGEKVVGTAQIQGTEMMRIADLSVMNARVDVDENDIVLIKIGDTARVQIDAYPDRTFDGVVYEIANSPKASGVGTQDEVVNFEVRIRIINPNVTLRPGMSCNVEIETETRENVIAVPLQSVTVRTDDKINTRPDIAEDDLKTQNTQKRTFKRPQSVVFVNKNGKAVITKVETGISDDGYIEVTKGLAEGTEIVSGSFQAINKELQDDMAIQIKKKESTSKTEKK